MGWTREGAEANRAWAKAEVPTFKVEGFCGFDMPTRIALVMAPKIEAKYVKRAFEMFGRTMLLGGFSQDGVPRLYWADNYKQDSVKGEV